ncbi:hypothetical protein ACGFIW_25490 [Micromonospora sp. NPDC048935]|uniref:hypothetical protein n=1 Tax=Micromonospora sp. NPDC048935 TaxID=3364262 RepID=UPI00371EE00F
MPNVHPEQPVSARSDRVLLDGAVDYRATDPGVIASSELCTACLLRQVTVVDGTRACLGAVAESAALARIGATVDYTCPGPVDTVTVAVRTLTDLNPAYRAAATGPDGQRAVYGAGEDSHDWILDGTPAVVSTRRGSGAAVPPGLPGIGAATLVGGALVIAAAVLLVSRRRRRLRAVASRP